MSILRAPALQQPLVFVDIETNGLNAQRGKIIEIAAIRVENGEVVKTFQTLLDPGTPLPQFITRLTGITANDLHGAPYFEDIAEELSQVLSGAIFVAHNVRFDYSFIKQEFARVGSSFSPQLLCTVRLSRALYPQEKSHKLASLITRHNFTYSHRHRAYDDAAVLWQFIKHVNEHFPVEQVTQAVSQQIKTPSIPKNVPVDTIKRLPEGPGVYTFYGQAGQPIYIGKSVSIKKRVMSHFSRDHADAKEFAMSQHVYDIKAQTTAGELTALLLESQQIKQLQPQYNRRLRRLQKMLLIVRERDALGYDQLHMQDADEIGSENTQNIMAVYATRGKARTALSTITKNNSLCPKLMGLEKATGACFLRQLHKCLGACEQEESPDSYNARVQAAFDNTRIHDWPYKKAIVIEEQYANTAQAIVVDKWRVLGWFTQEADCDPVFTADYQQFDIDTYKILRSQLTGGMRNFTIKQIDTAVLHELTNS